MLLLLGLPIYELNFRKTNNRIYQLMPWWCFECFNWYVDSNLILVMIGYMMWNTYRMNHRKTAIDMDYQL